MGSNKRKKETSDEEDSTAAKKRKVDPGESEKTQGATSDESQDEMDKLQLLVSAFSNAQQDQYEVYRRSTFPKAAVKKIMQSVAGASIPQNAVIAMAGIAKVFVGELVEEACVSREKLGEQGPLQPKHIREAARKLKNKGKLPNSRYKKTFTFR